MKNVFLELPLSKSLLFFVELISFNQNLGNLNWILDGL